MKRYSVLKKILPCLKDNDIAVFSNNEICKEAFGYDKSGNFYMLDSFGISLSLALGIAMGTDKRVFVFSSENDFLREIGSVAQMAVSKCNNIFYIIFASGSHQSSGGQFNIFNGLSSVKGVLANFGLLVYDYTPIFKDNNKLSRIDTLIDRLRGPLVVLIKVDKGLNKKAKNVTYSKTELRDRIINFVGDKELNTSLFSPPSFLDVTQFENVKGE